MVHDFHQSDLRLKLGSAASCTKRSSIAESSVGAVWLGDLLTVVSLGNVAGEVGFRSLHLLLDEWVIVTAEGFWERKSASHLSGRREGGG